MPTKTLPERPSLTQLKLQAKELTQAEDPTMEDAFIALIEASDQDDEAEAA